MNVSEILRSCVALLAAIALALLVFLAVYMPAFVLAGGLRLPLNEAVPTVMLVTLAIALALIGAFARRYASTVARFGMDLPAWRHLAYAVGFAVPLGLLVAWGLAHAGETGPLAGLSLPTWQVYLYFVLGSPVQEEVIYRGLLQTLLARRLASSPTYSKASATIAMFLAASLFGAVHLQIGPATAAGALMLGLLAGRLRQQSGSLLPGIVCHALFNLAGIVCAAN